MTPPYCKKSLLSKHLRYIVLIRSLGQLCYIVFKLRVIITVSFVGSDVPERLVEMIFGVALAVETFIAEA